MNDLETIFETFLNATLETFKVQCSIELKAVSTEDDYHSHVTSVLGVNSSDYQGSLSISFAKETMKRVLVGLLGEDVSTDSIDFADAVSELTNIIFGVAKKELNSKGHDFQMALPKLFVGKDIYMPKSSGTEEFKQAFEIEGDKFQIKLSVKSIS